MSEVKNSVIQEIIKKIQRYVFERRLRIDEAFADFDPYRHKVITSTQFIRAYELLAQYYQVQNGMIHYANFCDDVNKVFCLYKHLEKYPTVEIPQPALTKDEKDILLKR
ncbi:hypothetical protein Pmar_PMAR018741 [Perkinsus marinus ATCC 50983]|uniref:EF-hand domain-containing protein n=1 Tax=Perkinsus marinus (strain ATCC 50983 / TXsc) TaxID=423536 RepID=C5KJ87_PERM5|nr:hypothetical protein Pmar_PMAR018741 [Perkinsus marinus ATCC 50983]EER15389.1 hypothetical protein Pmar_PMAR018741 [Perkinsus marinus ATCC 50983]|eukprot:XP_002783593.1 hypothetical protein Pmar_PMAR018741 [Perkinsus marinus ATCC 50983]